MSDEPEPVPAPSVPAEDSVEASQPAPPAAPATWTRALNRPIALAAIAGGMLIVVAGTLALARSGATAGGAEPVQPVATPVAAAPLTSLNVEPLAVKIVARPEARTRRRNAPPPFALAFDEAIKPYRAGDYATAARRLQDLAALFPDAPEPLIYGGVSELLLGRPHEAIELFTRASPLTREVFVEDLVWYLALAKRATGQSAMMELRTLCGAGGERGPRACVAVREIESRNRNAGELRQH